MYNVSIPYAAILIRQTRVHAETREEAMGGKEMKRSNLIQIIQSAGRSSSGVRHGTAFSSDGAGRPAGDSRRSCGIEVVRLCHARCARPACGAGAPPGQQRPSRGPGPVPRPLGRPSVRLPPLGGLRGTLKMDRATFY